MSQVRVRRLPASQIAMPTSMARTPATNIPIVSEEESRAAQPDLYFVLPWHFRDGFIARERAFLERGGKFVFPLPRFEVYPQLISDQ